MTVDEFNALSAEAARDALAACCGAPGWVARMAARRPFAGRAALLQAADDAWRDLAPEERMAAIAHHPRIGEARAAAPTSARADAWSALEQSGARAADDATRAAIARGNAEYERRFGHPFIICASGRSAADIVGTLQARLQHDADTETSVTSEELRKIALLRLEMLLADS